ncbi:MAG: DUF1780 domain-containing protein [Phycisphaerae bacterium]
MNSDEAKEREYLSNLEKYQQESLKLLQNHEWIEKKSVKAFLRICGVQFKDEELIKISNGKQPPDFRFRDANFELTERLNENRRRGDEYKNKIRKTKEAKYILDLGEKPQSSVPIEFPELLKEIEKSMDKKFSKYNNAKTCENLDLLVYLNISQRHLNPQSERRLSPKFLSKVEKQGWRSISFLTNHCAGVIFSKRNSPDFIRNLGRDVRWWTWSDGRSAFED